MATKASAVRNAIVEALKSEAGDWEFLWSEYQKSRSEADAFWRETVSPAQARLGAILCGSLPQLPRAAPAVALAAYRAQLLRSAFADCEASERRHEALLDEVCRLQEALLLAPAPNEAALWWKVDQLRGCSSQISADTRRVLNEDAVRFSGQLGGYGARF